MNKKENNNAEKHGPVIKPFNRDFYSETDEFTYIGDGPMGGKAQGLAHIKEKIVSHFQGMENMPIIVNIPRLTVITTTYFDRFMQQNNLYDIAYSDSSDERIAHHFITSQLPAELTGDLRALIANVHSPLAVRSSSLLEDSLENPFAGVYHTKMIPNNQSDIDTRFHKLTEAVKLVYASTYFSNAKSYIKTTSHSIQEEKMAVIIQEVVGIHHNKRFYPNISGVARSYNFYPSSDAKPEDGVVNLALGLGKTIVDGDVAWTYSPEYPEVAPPYTTTDLLKNTQLEFWAVNMDKPTDYDPVTETEYMVKLGLKEAEYDKTLSLIASTYDYESDRINMGIGFPGPRLINFAPLLHLDLVPVNRLIKAILELCEQVFKAKVEIEFAITIQEIDGGKKRGAVRFVTGSPHGDFSPNGGSR
jgi:pyruvate phosphate dikinase-like enzyme